MRPRAFHICGRDPTRLLRVFRMRARSTCAHASMMQPAACDRSAPRVLHARVAMMRRKRSACVRSLPYRAFHMRARAGDDAPQAFRMRAIAAAVRAPHARVARIASAMRADGVVRRCAYGARGPPHLSSLGPCVASTLRSSVVWLAPALMLTSVTSGWVLCSLHAWTLYLPGLRLRNEKP